MSIDSSQFGMRLYIIEISKLLREDNNKLDPLSKRLHLYKIEISKLLREDNNKLDPLNKRFQQNYLASVLLP